MAFCCCVLPLLTLNALQLLDSETKKSFKRLSFQSFLSTVSDFQGCVMFVRLSIVLSLLPGALFIGLHNTSLLYKHHVD